MFPHSFAIDMDGNICVIEIKLYRSSIFSTSWLITFYIVEIVSNILCLVYIKIVLRKSIYFLKRFKYVSTTGLLFRW